MKTNITNECVNRTEMTIRKDNIAGIIFISIECKVAENCYCLLATNSETFNNEVELFITEKSYIKNLINKKGRSILTPSFSIYRISLFTTSAGFSRSHAFSESLFSFLNAVA